VRSEFEWSIEAQILDASGQPLAGWAAQLSS
jgi:hypothetical protein